MYNLSMLSALIEHLGESRAESWARAVRGNLARDPKGGDSDQVKGVAQGECDVALVNHYYYARFARSDKAEDKTVTERVGVVFPDQRGRGTHVNISGAAVLKAAPHRDIAVKFLEYLASDEAQVYFADGNNEWPVVQSVAVSNPVLASFDRFKVDALNVAALGRHQAAAQRTYDRVGWK
jgi:iron(III) transport system substrate-binding protein